MAKGHYERSYLPDIDRVRRGARGCLTCVRATARKAAAKYEAE